MNGNSKYTPLVLGAAGLLAAAVHAADHIGWLHDPAPLGIELSLPAAMLCLTALLWIAHTQAQRATQLASRQLLRMAEGGAINPTETGIIGAEPGLLGPLNKVLERCRDELDKLRGGQNQLEIRCQVVAAEMRHLEAIVQAISDAVVVSNSFDELRLANPAARRLLHLADDMPARCPIDQVVTDPRLVELIRDARARGPRQRPRTVEFQMPVEGQDRTYQVQTRGYEDASDGTVGVITVFQDVTREKEIARMKTEFVSTVSHELRSPLTSIRAYVELLLDDDNDPKSRKEFHQIIAVESERLSRLIDNILNISRIEAGVVKVVKEPLDLTAIVKGAADVAVSQAKSKNQEIVIQLGPVFGQVEGDRDMLNQVVTNLLSNAMKYTPEGGKITVSTAVDEARKVARFSVQDTGVGISPQDQPRVFEKFFRIRKDSHMAKGTGLGLSLVKHMVEDVHGGAISLTSELGKGSMFTVELPLCK